MGCEWLLEISWLVSCLKVEGQERGIVQKTHRGSVVHDMGFSFVTNHPPCCCCFILQGMFAELDTDNDGLIDSEAFSKGLAAAGAKLSESDVKEFMEVCQVGSGESGGGGER